VIVSAPSSRGADLQAALGRSGVQGAIIGRSGGQHLVLGIGAERLVLPVEELEAAWRTPFAGQG
jgi:hypothetical protein